MALQVEYRPKKLKNLVGNTAVVESLQSVLSRKKEIPSTFLFTGPSGCGKTTLARIVKNELKCDDTDFIELNAADDRGIDSIRTLREGLKYAPMGGKKKVILLDEAHMLTPQSQEALLKILEEPPEYVHICIATTNPEKLKPTFKRRCHQYELSPLRESDIHKVLDNVLEKEGVKKFPKKLKEKIIDLSDGSAGQALKLLDMVIDMTDTDKAIRTLQSAGTSQAEVKELCQALINGRSGDVQIFLKLYKGDAESARYAIAGYLNSVMLNKWDSNMCRILDCFSDTFISSGKAGLTVACYYALNGE